jgi:hypothetical protein
VSRQVRWWWQSLSTGGQCLTAAIGTGTLVAVVTVARVVWVFFR